MADRYVLGIDGGGTKTHAVVVDESGAIIGQGTAGPGNWETIGLDQIRTVYATAINAALAAAAVEIQAAAFALAGMDWPSDDGRLRPILKSLGLPGPLVLVNDAFGVLRAGCAEPFGAVSNAGTGTITAARNRAGETARTLAVQGYGERGGADDLVEDALQAIARTHHGQAPPTLLTDRFLAAFRCASVAELFEGLSRHTLVRSPDLAPLVLATAAEGDRAAAEIARKLGRDLGSMLVATAGRVGLRGERFRAVRSGGVHRAGSAPLDAAFADAVADGCPRAEIVLLEAPPALGAAMLALDELRGDRRGVTTSCADITETSHMAREIAEQPLAVERTLRESREAVVELSQAMTARGISRVLLIARGTSDNACIYARYLLEARCGLACSLAAPSLYTRYAAPVDLRGTLAIAVSQSGETPEIVDALEYTAAHGAMAAAITNVETSSLARAAEFALITRAGVEQSVAATKTFITQLALFALLASELGASAVGAALDSLPTALASMLANDDEVDEIAEVLSRSPDALCVGRGFSFAIALEAALKLKETTGIWAEGYSSADLLHGPRAAVRPGMPTLLFRSDGAVSADLDSLSSVLSDADVDTFTLQAPHGLLEELAPLVLILPAQRIAERTARLLGRDPDRPRGLTKVTATH